MKMFSALRGWQGALAAFTSLALLSLTIPPLVSVASATWLVQWFTYPVLLLALYLWGASLWRMGTESWNRRSILPRGEWVWAGSLVVFFSTLAISAEPFRCKIIFDEFVLQLTASNLHHHRVASVITRGYEVLGEFLPLSGYLDKRPNFYPFLVSLAHDLTGYRVANAFFVNAALYPLTLGLAYYLGRRLHGPWGARLAVVLLGSLPLLGQNATGSGMELLNVCMILAVAALGGAYLRQPDGHRLSALVFGAVLLAHTRYESAAYIICAALIVLAGWMKRKAVVMVWPVVLAPLLLLPILLQSKVMNHTPMSWELYGSAQARFSTAYLAKNLKGAFSFIFSTSRSDANSFVLAVLGLAAVAWLAFQAVRSRTSPLGMEEDRSAMFLVGLGALGNTGLLMFYFWSSFDDVMASRLSLPLHLVFTFAAVIVAGDLWAKVRVLRGVLVAASLAAVLAATGHYAKPLYSTTGIERATWEMDFVATRPPGTRLVLCNDALVHWMMREIPALLIGEVPRAQERLRRCMRDSVFEEVLVVQTSDLLPKGFQTGDAMVIPPDGRLPAGFELKLLVERRFGDRITRISRLVAIHGPLPASQPTSSKVP